MEREREIGRERERDNDTEEERDLTLSSRTCVCHCETENDSPFPVLGTSAETQRLKLEGEEQTAHRSCPFSARLPHFGNLNSWTLSDDAWQLSTCLRQGLLGLLHLGHWLPPALLPFSVPSPSWVGVGRKLPLASVAQGCQLFLVRGGGITCSCCRELIGLWF